MQPAWQTAYLKALRVQALQLHATEFLAWALSYMPGNLSTRVEFLNIMELWYGTGYLGMGLTAVKSPFYGQDHGGGERGW